MGSSSVNERNSPNAGNELDARNLADVRNTTMVERTSSTSFGAKLHAEQSTWLDVKNAEFSSGDD